jgi:hypothetical protein
VLAPAVFCALAPPAFCWGCLELEVHALTESTSEGSNKTMPEIWIRIDAQYTRHRLCALGVDAMDRVLQR